MSGGSVLLLPLSRSGANGCPCAVSLQSITAWGSERFVACRANKTIAVEGHGITATQGARWHARRDRASLIGFRTGNASFPAVPYGVALCNYEALRAKLPLQLPRPFPRRQRLPRRCHRLPRRRLNLQRPSVHCSCRRTPCPPAAGIPRIAAIPHIAAIPFATPMGTFAAIPCITLAATPCAIPCITFAATPRLTFGAAPAITIAADPCNSIALASATAPEGPWWSSPIGSPGWSSPLALPTIQWDCRMGSLPSPGPEGRSPCTTTATAVTHPVAPGQCTARTACTAPPRTQRPGPAPPPLVQTGAKRRERVGSLDGAKLQGKKKRAPAADGPKFQNQWRRQRLTDSKIQNQWRRQRLTDAKFQTSVGLPMGCRRSKANGYK